MLSRYLLDDGREHSPNSLILWKEGLRVSSISSKNHEDNNCHNTISKQSLGKLSKVQHPRPTTTDKPSAHHQLLTVQEIPHSHGESNIPTNRQSQRQC
ncbi:hypothetical protein GIB67_021978, partial [Kingdonia uniflora]